MNKQILGGFNRMVHFLVWFRCFVRIHNFEISTTESRKGFTIYKCKDCPQRKHVKTDVEVYG